MDLVLTGLHWSHCLVYLDNVIVLGWDVALCAVSIARNRNKEVAPAIFLLVWQMTVLSPHPIFMPESYFYFKTLSTSHPNYTRIEQF